MTGVEPVSMTSAPASVLQSYQVFIVVLPTSCITEQRPSASSLTHFVAYLLYAGYPLSFVHQLEESLKNDRHLGSES